MTYRFVISGPCRTKKTSNQGVVIPGKGGGKARAIMFPAKEWREWCKDARIGYDGGVITFHRKRALLVTAEATTEWPAVGFAVNCRAVFYLGNCQHGDALGYMQGLADLLEARGVVANDRLLVSWDGTRCVHDGSTPRVEVTLEPATVALEGAE